MKELMFCYKTEDKKLVVRHTIPTDVFVPIQDIISPQKTTFSIPKTNKVQLNDIVIIRDNDTNVVEYIGYIDTLSNKVNTEISCYPLINVFDNDYVLDQMFEKSEQQEVDGNGNLVYNEDETPKMVEVDIDVDVAKWLTTQLNRAFIGTEDYLQALPLIITNRSKKPVFYKKVLETSNLFEVYVDLFINTGIYIVFSGLGFNGSEIDGIYCDIHCNTDELPYPIREDNPSVQNVDIVDNTFTNYNKIIATEELADNVVGTREPQRYYFYLLSDNSVTRDANNPKRIKQVRSKEMTFKIDGGTAEENVKNLILAVHNELQAPEYNLQIVADVKNVGEIKLYRRVDFYAESGIMYSTNITKIERLNDLQVRITLGALRNSLTDFKKRVEVI